MSALRCYLVDDEELPLSSLVRMLRASGRVEVVGCSTDPALALEEIPRLQPDALFLDIHMPDIDGFQLLASLPGPPAVVFTTAYDRYAVRAFEVNSVDYLLKPVGYERLLGTIDRLEQLRERPAPGIDRLLEVIHQAMQPKGWLKRVGTVTGDSVSLLDVDRITHFVSEDRYSYACTENGRFLVSEPLGELEERLDPSQFLRIHRSAIVNLKAVGEVSRWFAGRVLVRLTDRKRTELTVSRDRVKQLRTALGLRT